MDSTKHGSQESSQAIHADHSDIATESAAVRQAEEALRESEERFRTMADGLPLIVWVHDVDGNQEFVNRTFCEFFGVSEDEMRGGRWKVLMHPDDAESYTQKFAEALSNRSPFHEEVRVKRGDGQWRWLESWGRPRFSYSGKFLGFVGTSADITDRKEMEGALRESEEQYRSVFESVDEGFAVIQLIFDDENHPVDYCFLETNPVFLQQTGLRNPIGKTARELVPDLDESWFQIYGKVALTGEAFRFENEAPAMNRWFDTFAFRVGVPEKRKVALLFKDVTGRKRRELNAAFLAAVNADLATLSGSDDIMNAVAARVLAHLEVSRIVFAEVNEPAEEAEIIYERHTPGISSALGVHKLEDFLDNEYVKDLTKGKAVVIDNVATDKRTAAKVDSYKSFEVLSLIIAPHISDGRLKFLIAIYHDAQHIWRQDEVDLTRDLATRLWLRLERARAEEALRATDRRKDQFLAVLSHELRNPLAPIRNGVHILEHAAPGSTQAKRALEIIDRQTDHLTKLTEDLLDVTRISQGKVNLQTETVDFKELLSNTLEDHKNLFGEKNIELEVQVSDEPVLVNGDATRLVQVVGNLLSNACKFTPQGGRVALSLENDQHGHAFLHVVDNGMGMSQDTLRSIFEPFIQADATMSRSRGGLGLGLALVKGLVEMHGGEVRAESPGLGKGAKFTVSIPTAEAVGDIPKASERTEGSTALRVLVVEDNQDIAESLQMVLELGGRVVQVAEDGEEGVQLAREFKPDVVLCDIGLPGMDGYQVAKALRSDSSLDSPYLVALSGYAQARDIEQAKEAGFDTHMAKPPNLKLLEEILGAATNSRVRARRPY